MVGSATVVHQMHLANDWTPACWCSSASWMRFTARHNWQATASRQTRTRTHTHLNARVLLAPNCGPPRSHDAPSRRCPAEPLPRRPSAPVQAVATR
eukprot:6211583-Prymnesium_polylepis.1